MSKPCIDSALCRWRAQRYRLKDPPVWMAQPVCGTDGITYSNICDLHDAACDSNELITVSQWGECEYECKACLWEGPPEPVCGSDGITYENKCTLEDANCKSKEKISIAYDRECIRVCPMCLDPSDIDPTYKDTSVCGTDGITYSSSCMLTLKNCHLSFGEAPVGKLHDGDCVPRKYGRIIINK